MSYSLNFFGVGVLVDCDSPELMAALKGDYGFFETSVTNLTWKISIHRQSFEPGRWWPALKTRRSTVYWSKPGTRRVRFFKKCFVDCDFNQKRADLYFVDEIAGYESLYFVLESILSFELDERGLHRLHGFGANIDGGSVVVLGRSGAGKSTLFANWCSDPKLKFLGDDMVVTGEQEVFAYPAKISFKEMPAFFPRSEIREFVRQQYGLRYLLDSRTMRARFEKHLPWGKIILLRRAKGIETAELRAVNRWVVLSWLVRWLVVGYETPQIAELFLPLSFSAVKRKFRHLASRARRAWQISRKVPGYLYVAPEGPARMATFLRESLARY